MLQECQHRAQLDAELLANEEEHALTAFTPIVERHLWLADIAVAGAPTDIYIEIGSPHGPGSGGQVTCQVLIRGLMPDAIDIYGSDSFSAMQCAMEFAEGELKALPATMAVQWPGGEPYFDKMP